MNPRSWRILVVHNAYQLRGGEDAVVEDEIELLRARGHDVATYLRTNDDAHGMSSTALAMDTLWSRRTRDEIAALLAQFRPHVIHAHNTFPLISPSLYWAAARAGVPVVQTLHNFRLLCLNALFLREGRVCEDCQGRLPWRGVVRGCYRGSTSASATVASMLALHRGIGTFRHKVSRFIALSEFSRGKFIEAGLPAGRIAVKPNFVDFPAPQDVPRASLLYVGRLSPEKGVATLAQAVKLLSRPALRVAGEGPVGAALVGLPGVERLGVLDAAAVRHEMNHALALVVPSICYENFPRTIAEAFACGTPVVASRIGALATIVRDGYSGLLFNPGDARDLADKLAWARQNPQQMAQLGRQARAEYEAEFSADVSYRRLLEIYAEAIADSQSQHGAVAPVPQAPGMPERPEVPVERRP